MKKVASAIQASVKGGKKESRPLRCGTGSLRHLLVEFKPKCLPVAVSLTYMPIAISSPSPSPPLPGIANRPNHLTWELMCPRLKVVYMYVYRLFINKWIRWRLICQSSLCQQRKTKGRRRHRIQDSLLGMSPSRYLCLSIATHHRASTMPTEWLSSKLYG